MIQKLVIKLLLQDWCHFAPGCPEEKSDTVLSPSNSPYTWLLFTKRGSSFLTFMSTLTEPRWRHRHMKLQLLCKNYKKKKKVKSRQWNGRKAYLCLTRDYINQNAAEVRTYQCTFCHYFFIYRSNDYTVCLWSNPNTPQNTITCIYTIWLLYAPKSVILKRNKKTGKGWIHSESPLLIHFIYYFFNYRTTKWQISNKYFPFQCD